MDFYPPIVYPNNHGEVREELRVVAVEILLALRRRREGGTMDVLH